MMGRFKKSIKKNYDVIFLLTLIFIAILMLTVVNAPTTNAFQPVKGVMDIAGWNLESKESILLNGQWELYWKRFIDFGEQELERPDLYVNVPNSWDKYILGGNVLPIYGYATYRLRVKTKLPAGTQLGMYLGSVSGAYELYINDRLIASDGHPAVHAADEIFMLKPQIMFFALPAEEFDIIIHVSNFHYGRSGFRNSACMGSIADIRRLYNNYIAETSFINGAFIIAVVYCFMLYLLYDKRREALYFLFTCISGLIMFDCLGYNLITRIFPAIGLEYENLIWYSSLLWGCIFLIAFLHEILKSSFSTVILKISVVSGVLFQAAYILSLLLHSHYLLAHAGNFGSINIPGYCFMVGAIMIIFAGIIKGKKDALLNLVGILALTLNYFIGTFLLVNGRNGIPGKWTSFGIILFLVIQLNTIAKYIKEMYEKIVTKKHLLLQEQLKPSLIVGMIDAIRNSSFQDGVRTVDLLGEFGDFLTRRLDLKAKHPFIPLEEELSLTKEYLSIIQERFVNKIKVIITFPEDTEVQVPAFLLQQAVEAALDNLSAAKAKHVIINISIIQKKKKLLFAVLTDRLETSVNAKPLVESATFDNVNKRLMLLYNQRIHIRSSSTWIETSWGIPIRRK